MILSAIKKIHPTVVQNEIFDLLFSKFELIKIYQLFLIKYMQLMKKNFII